jgi:hypothetical protein
MQTNNQNQNVNKQPGDCLGLGRASEIVQECSRGPHDIDKTLEQVGLISDNERLVFRECVFDKVLSSECQISREDIPNDADTTLREVRDTISDLAS